MNATCQSYGAQLCGVTHHGGQLAFTGIDLGFVALIGVFLLIVGLSVRTYLQQR